MAVQIHPTEKQKQSEFAQLLEKKEGKTSLEEGGLVRGKIVQITDNFAIIDIGFKSEGRISINEFKDRSGELTIKPGDEVDLLLENIEDDQGFITLSKERADTFKAWDALVKIQDEGGLVEGTVVGKVKGGLVIDVGVKAFLPTSQIDARPVRSVDRYLGKKYKFKIVKLNKRRGNIVLSRKDAMPAESGPGVREDILQNIKEGQLIEGTVKNVTEYGAFVDLGGMDGLLHVTDMSWGRVGHPSDLFKVNDAIKVVVLKIDSETKRVSLGYKQLQDDPWKGIEGKFPVGSKIKGRVVSLADYGAFVELCPGVEGLVHVSEISWNKKMKHPSQELTPGQEAEAIVLDCDVEARRIALGMKQLKPNPWDVLEKQYPVGSKMDGVVRNLTDFGLFVDCGVGMDGLVHISDLRWVQNFQHPDEIYKKGDRAEVVILNIDRDQERFALGIKQLLPNPWSNIKANYFRGTPVDGKVVKVKPYGVEIEVEEGIVGLLPKPAKEFKEGETVAVEVDLLEEEARKFYFKIK